VVVVPSVGKVPLQPPDAAQVLALVAFHCSMTDVPMGTALSLAFKVTNGGAATTGVVALPVALPLGGVLLAGPLLAVVDSALELIPHAASEPSAANPSIDFNANAIPKRWLRRIELITRLPRSTATTFFAELESFQPQSLRSHIRSIFRIRQPVAICKLHMFSDAKNSYALSVSHNVRARILVAHGRQQYGPRRERRQARPCSCFLSVIKAYKNRLFSDHRTFMESCDRAPAAGEGTTWSS
jgi:hypothetical protein